MGTTMAPELPAYVPRDALARMPIASKFDVLALGLLLEEIFTQPLLCKANCRLDLFPLTGVTFLYSFHCSAEDFLPAYSSS
jgi:hypothetical protein